jgi:hypothetical protein
VRIGKYQSDKFPIQNGLKQGAALSPLLWNTPLGGSERTRKGLKLNGTHQLLAYADDLHIVRKNIGTMKKNTEALLGSSKEVSLEVHQEKTKYILPSRSQKINKSIA